MQNLHRMLSLINTYPSFFSAHFAKAWCASLGNLCSAICALVIIRSQSDFIVGNLRFKFHSRKGFQVRTYIRRNSDLSSFVKLWHSFISLNQKVRQPKPPHRKTRDSKLSPNKLFSNRLSHTILKPRLAFFPKHVVSKLYAKKGYNTPYKEKMLFEEIKVCLASSL